MNINLKILNKISTHPTQQCIKRIIHAFPIGATGLRGAWPSPLPATVCAPPLTSVYCEKGESSGKNFNFACCVQISHLT